MRCDQGDKPVDHHTINNINFLVITIQVLMDMLVMRLLTL